jgi:hypothetical protein
MFLVTQFPPLHSTEGALYPVKVPCHLFVGHDAI